MLGIKDKNGKTKSEIKMKSVEKNLSVNPNSQIILRLDQVNRPIQIKQTIEIEDCWKNLWKFYIIMVTKCYIVKLLILI